MPSRRPRSRRFLLPMILAAVLAAEVTGIALARTLNSPVSPNPVVALAAAAASAPAAGLDRSGSISGPAAGEHNVRDLAATPATETRIRTRGLTISPFPLDLASSVRVLRESTRPKATSSTGAVRASTGGAPSSASYHGTNRVWIPSLGINKGIQSFPCSRKRPPDAGVYRWGCSGRNNVYLLSHAWSTFKPLHDAYVGGRLRKGMKVVYADGGGRVNTYSVIWWKVTAPTTAASWAWASLSRPSMTLQTCVGSKSQYRLMVRLVRVG